ncbi:MAG: glycoside hydrolase family 15 protein [bacterium]
MDDLPAPGWPGIEPRWTSSAKSAVGTSANPASRVWFTLSHGIVNEVYYPSVDTANTRDFGLLVADGRAYFSEEKRDCTSRVEPFAPGVPGFRLTNTPRDGRYLIEKSVFTHPRIDALLQRIRFTPGSPDQRLYALLAPHVQNRGRDNDGWIGDYKGIPMLFARRRGVCLALASSGPFAKRSVGFAGTSDGWQDLSANFALTATYGSARNGNVALTAELCTAESHQEFVLALGFGSTPSEAGQRARLALEEPFERLQEEFIADWDALHKDSRPLPPAPLAATSRAVLLTHESKSMPGGFVASLSIPWGSSKGDDDLGGYHLVWPRDLVEIAGGLLAAGDSAAALRAFKYLVVTQEADGSWPQNMWLDGKRYWGGIQMDEVGFPILLAGQLWHANALADIDPWSTIRKAASFLVRNGPVTQQDRWEEDAGYSPFTLAVEVAALVVAAGFAKRAAEHDEAEYLLEMADLWNASIEQWTYATGTAVSESLGIDGYYVRIAPEGTDDNLPMARRTVRLKNRDLNFSDEPAAAIISADALALVRFGLRRADDPRIRSTVTAVDATLKSTTTTGPIWHRYTDDGYGEHDDGSPFDGTGTGRGWPLLAGERGHYELAAGNASAAAKLLATMEQQASIGGLFPEQVWDASDLPGLELFNGHPAGSAMPLAWAHAEYLKLARSLEMGAVTDTPPETYQRYVVDGTRSSLSAWRFNNKCRSIPAGRTLRVETLASATVVWTADGWKTQNTLQTHSPGFGMHVADIPTAQLAPGNAVVFTFLWEDANRWEGADFQVDIGEQEL